MKFRIYGMVLSLFFALGLVFSFAIDASASHGGSQSRTADQVDPGDEQQVMEFLSHVVEYYEDVRTSYTGDELTRELIIYGRKIREEGAYKYSNPDDNPIMYSMAINGRGYVTNHAGYPKLFGREFKSDAGTDLASTIQALIDGFPAETMPCEDYRYDGQDRVACATKVESPSGNITVIAGLHHADNDAAFGLPDACSNLMLDTTARNVYEDHSKLEDYVKDIIGAAQQLMVDSTNAVIAEPVNAPLLGQAAVLATNPQDPDGLAAAAEFQVKIFERVYDSVACFASGDLRHKNIYTFIMGTDMDGTVLLNGNNFDLNGLNLLANDNELPGDDKSIAGLFRNALTEGESREPEAGDFATVKYRWDDPDDPNDTIDNWLEDGLVPGSSPKISYIEVANINHLLRQNPVFGSLIPDFLYIFGSGTYPDSGMMPEEMMPEEMMPEEMMPEEMMPEEMMPEEMMPEEMMPEEMMEGGVTGGGCTIAGTGHTSQNTLLNLFLIASVLFSVVFLRRRV